MTLDDKRKVIEVLLCCSCEWSPDVTDGAADGAGHRSQTVKDSAGAAWGEAFSDLCAVRGEHVYHHEASAEAAYRLIETSPTLRREWFGR